MKQLHFLTCPVISAISILIFTALPYLSTAESFEFTYDAEVLPTESDVAWVCTVDNNESLQRVTAAANGVLSVITTENRDNAAWSVGSWKTAEGSEQWNLTPDGKATVDFQIRVPESTPTGVFQLQITDGVHHWSYSFNSGSVTFSRSGDDKPLRHSVDNAIFQLYRIVFENGKTSLYQAGRAEPVLTASSASGKLSGTARNALTFGDFSNGAHGRFDLNFMRWTLAAAMQQSPEDVDISGLVPAETQQLRRSEVLASGKPSILFIGWHKAAQTGGATFKMFLRELVSEQGYQVAFRAQEFAYRDYAGEVDPEEFSNYDILVYLEPVYAKPDGELTESFHRQWSAVLDFVKSGGGLLYFPVQTEPYLYSTNKCFQTLGLETLAAKPVDNAATTGTVMRIAFSRTERLDQDHPVTAGLDGLWVPLYGSEQSQIYNANSVSFRCDDRWQVISRFAPAVRTVAESFHGLAKALPEPTEADGEQSALLAVRQLERGRIAFLGLNAAYHIVGGRAPGYENIFLDAGLKGQASDGKKLIVNLLEWLGQNALQTESLGGAPTEKEAIEPPRFEPLPALSTPEPFSAQRRQYRGIIGALSPRSGGRNTVAEFAARTRELGFDFLVVLDDIGVVTEAEFALTDADCAAETTATFKCIAGLRGRDEVGNHYVIFRQGLRVPTAEVLTAKNRFKTVHEKNSFLGVGRFVQTNGHKMAVVFYRDQTELQSDDPYRYGTPAWDIRPYRTFHSVFTYNENGEKIDEMIEPHKVTVNDGQHVHPVALTFLDQVADLQKIADGELPFTVRWTDDFQHFPHDTDEAPAYLPTSYATEGPEITRWQWDSRDLVSNGKYWDWTYYYQRWGIGVAADAGLKTVEVWDGTELVRRWQLQGEKTFDTVCTVTKHQLTMPLLVVTDINGKRAVTDGFQWRNHNFYVSWCSDRVNTLSYSALPSPESPWKSSAGTWPLPTMPKGPFWDNVRVDLNLDILRFPGFDGQAHGNVSISPKPNFYAAEGEARDGRYYRHITWPVGSHEAVIQESVVEHQLLPEQKAPHAWSTLGPIRETDLLKGRLRYTTFVHWGHDPAPVLVEGEFTFKQAVKVAAGRHPFMIANISGGQAEADYRAVAVQRTGERDQVLAMLHNQHDRQTLSGRLAKGAYIWYWPSMFGPMGVISLDDDIHYSISHSPNRYFSRLYHGEPGRTYRQGETVRWRYLAVTSGFNDHSGTDTPERIVDLLGIDGTPGYQVEVEKGSVLSSEYLLRLLPAPGQGGFRGKLIPGDEIVRNGLPAALPIVIQEMNDKWTAVLYDAHEKAMRPLPVAEGCALAHYRDLRETRAIFMGHPFTASDADVVVQVVQTGPDSIYVNVHNPTLETKAVQLSRSPLFNAIPAYDQQEWSWNLQPGDERHLHLGPETAFTPASVLAH